MNLSFCGCGFLAVYHLGVAKALLQHGQGLLSQIQRVSGASAGALAGALLVIKPESMEVSYLHVSELQIRGYYG